MKYIYKYLIIFSNKYIIKKTDGGVSFYDKI